jgi:hypothetical protein
MEFRNGFISLKVEFDILKGPLTLPLISVFTMGGNIYKAYHPITTRSDNKKLYIFRRKFDLWKVWDNPWYQI